MYAVNKIQSRSPRSRKLGVVAAAVLSLAACMPALSSTHTFREALLGVAGSANALEHLYLGHLALSGSANAVEYIYLSHLKAERGEARSANAAEHAG